MVEYRLNWFCAAALDYPYITALLPNQTIEVHNIETQVITQVLPAPPDDATEQRRALVTSVGGFLVPSRARSEKLRPVQVKLLRERVHPGGRTGTEGPEIAPKGDDPKEEGEGELEECVADDSAEPAVPYDI